MTAASIETKDFEIGKALEAGWNLLARRPGALLGYGFVVLLGFLIVQGLGFFLAWQAPDHKVPLWMNLVASTSQAVLSLLYVRTIFLCMDDQPADPGSVLSAFRHLISYLIGSFLFFIGFTLGLMVLIVPGIIFFLGFNLYAYAIIDQGMGPIESMKHSWEITRGVRLKLLLFWITLWMVIFAGLLCFGVGVIPAYIVTMAAICHVYRQLDSRAEPGQPA